MCVLKSKKFFFLKRATLNNKTTISLCRLFNCGISEESCEVLASVLSGKNSVLKELDLSENSLTDTETKMLNILLEDPGYKLNKIK